MDFAITDKNLAMLGICAIILHQSIIKSRHFSHKY